MDKNAGEKKTFRIFTISKGDRRILSINFNDKVEPSDDAFFT